MNFRSCTFMPSGFSNPENAVWYEAHQTDDGRMILAQLGGAPRRVGRPGWIRQLCTRSEPGKSKTLPPQALVLKTLDTPKAALDEMLRLEKAQLIARAELIDIGDARASEFGGVPHYAAVAEFDAVAFPGRVHDAVGDFFRKVSAHYLLGAAPRSMLEGAREAVKRYQQHGVTREVVVCTDASGSIPNC